MITANELLGAGVLFADRFVLHLKNPQVIDVCRWSISSVAVLGE
jgi:hypothetical protein